MVTQQEENEIHRILKFSEEYSIKPDKINDGLEKLGAVLPPRLQTHKLNFCLKLHKTIAPFIPCPRQELNKIEGRKEEIIEAEILIKYQGYIEEKNC